MFKKSKSLTYLFIFIFLATAQENSDPETISTPYSSDISLQNNELKYYVLNVDSVGHGKLAISVESKNKETTEIYLSFDTPKPNKASDLITVSKGGPGNSLILGAESLKSKTAYLGVKCLEQNCELHIAIAVAVEVRTNADGTEYVYDSSNYQESGSMIMTLTAPFANNADRIVIHAEILPWRLRTDFYFHMYVIQGDMTPDTRNHADLKTESWFLGKTIAISKDTSGFCTGCDYTISLSFPPGATVKFKAYVFLDITEIQHEQFFDVVRGGTRNIYHFPLPPEAAQNDLTIHARPEVGDTNLIVACNHVPDNNSPWIKQRYNLRSDEEIVITAREHHRCGTGNYFLIFYSDHDASYDFQVWNSLGTAYLLNERGKTAGSIKFEERLEYLFYIPEYIASKITIKVECKPPLDVDVFPCKFPSDCPGMPEGTPVDIVNFANDRKLEYKKTVQENYGTIVEIDVNQQNCWPIKPSSPNFYHRWTVPICAYKLSLYSPLPYTLPRPHNQNYFVDFYLNSHSLIIPGRPSYREISEGVFYYAIPIPDEETELQSIRIQFTTLSGDPQYYISQTNHYPSPDTECYNAQEGLLKIDRAILPKLAKYISTMNGTYYVGVKATEESSFYISVNIFGKNNTKFDHHTPIKEGVPHKGVIVPKEEIDVVFFRFKLDLPDDWVGSLVISVNPITNLRACIHFTGFYHCVWRFTDSHITIYSNDSEFRKRADYFLEVLIDFESPTAAFLDTITFQVDYVLISAHKEDEDRPQILHKVLTSLFPYSAEVSNLTPLYFVYYLSKNDISETISLHSDAGKIFMYLSLDGEKYPNEKTNYTHFSESGSEIQITQEEIIARCKVDTFLFSTTCPAYFSVSTDSATPLKFTLSLRRNRTPKEDTKSSDAVAIKDGLVYHGDIPDSSVVHLYYYPPRTIPTVLTIHSFAHFIGVYATVASADNTNINLLKSYPTNETCQKCWTPVNKEDSGFSNVYIDGSTEANPIILITLVFSYDTSIMTLIRIVPKYTILATSTIRKIYAGHSYTDAVSFEKYNYYSLYIPQDDTTLLVTLTSLTGEPDLYISPGKNTRPTKDDYAYASATKLRTEYLEITTKDIYPLKTMRGEWTIAVYGAEEAKYSLSALLEDSQMLELKLSEPMEMYVKKDSEMVFFYYHADQQDLDLNIDLQSGELEFYIATASSYDEIREKTPTAEKNQWKFLSSQDIEVTIGKTDANFCSDCYYIITASGILPAKFVISISSTVLTIQNGITYQASLKPKDSFIAVFNAKNFDDVRLSMHMNAPGIKAFASHNILVNQTLYTWKSEIADRRDKLNEYLKIDKDPLKNSDIAEMIWDGKKFVPSKSSLYYFYFYNPMSTKIDFSYSIASNDTHLVLKNGVKYFDILDQDGQSKFMFYSSERDKIVEIILEYNVELKELFGLNDFKAMKSLKFESLFWQESATAGSGKKVPLISNSAMVFNKDLSTYSAGIRHTILFSSQVGRYEFVIGNVYSHALNYTIAARHEEKGFHSYIGDVWKQVYLEPGATQELGIYVPEAGSLYLDFDRCDGDFDLIFADSLENLENSKGTSYRITDESTYFSSLLIKEAGYKYVKIASASKKNEVAVFSSVHFTEKEALPFEKVNPGILDSFSLTQDSEGLFYLHVAFTSLDFGLYKMKDAPLEVQYRISACPTESEADRSSICSVSKMADTCRIAILNGRDQTSAVLPFGATNMNKLTVTIAGVLIYNGKLVRTIPYKSKSVYLSENSKFNEKEGTDIILTIVEIVLLVAVASIVGFCVVKSIKKIDKKTNVELQNIQNKRQGYGLLDIE